MSRNTFYIVAGLLALALCGCKSNSSNNDSIPSGGVSVPVTVTDYSGNRVQGATVVLGDSNGAMKDYGLTDSNGEICFTNAAANATVTAATTCLRSGSTTTTYSIRVQYDVNAPVALTLDACSSPTYSILLPSRGPSPVGTVTVNVTDIPVEVTRNSLTVGRQAFATIGGLITSKTVTITGNDLNRDGTFSITVIGQDAQSRSIAYGIVPNQMPETGLTVTVSMKPFNFVQYHITNIPATAVTLRPDINGPGDSYSLSSAFTSTTVNVPYMSELVGEFSYKLNVDLDQDDDGIVDSRQSMSMSDTSGNPLSDQSFDLGKALSAPYVSVSNADTATPTFSWRGADPTAAYFSVGTMIELPNSQRYLDSNNVSRARTSITYPELPDSLAAFRPKKVNFFSVSTSASEGNLYKSSSGHYYGSNPL